MTKLVCHDIFSQSLITWLTGFLAHKGESPGDYSGIGIADQRLSETQYTGIGAKKCANNSTVTVEQNSRFLTVVEKIFISFKIVDIEDLAVFGL